MAGAEPSGRSGVFIECRGQVKAWTEGAAARPASLDVSPSENQLGSYGHRVWAGLN